MPRRSTWFAFSSCTMMTTVGFLISGSITVAAPRTTGAIGSGTVSKFDGVKFSDAHSPAVTKVGNIIFSPTNLLIMEIGGRSPGSEHDQIISSGHIVFDGTMQVVLINGFSPSLGEDFNLFDWVSASGSFDEGHFPALGNSLAWDTSQLYVDGTLHVAAELDGDFNHDGGVDAADHVAWAKGIGVASTPPNYILWQTNFGRTQSGGFPTSPQVPEPRSLLLLAVAAFWVLAGQRFAH